MIKAALEYINGLKAPSIESYGGGTYSDKPLYQMTRPDFPTLEMNTLESVVRYLKGIDDEREQFGEPTPTIIHIENERCVTLKDIANVAEGKRDCMVRAEAEVPKFNYGDFYDTESFNIALQSKFQETEDKATILQGGRQSEGGRSADDDGRRREPSNGGAHRGCNGGRCEGAEPCFPAPVPHVH